DAVLQAGRRCIPLADAVALSALSPRYPALKHCSLFLTLCGQSTEDGAQIGCYSSGRQTVFSPRGRGRTQCSLPPLPRLKTLLFISDTVWAIYRGWSSVLSRLLLFSLARSLRLSLPLCLLLSSSLSLSLSLSLAHILPPSIPGSLSLPP